MYAEVDSTNDVARELAHAHTLPEGAVIVATHQRMGRGQQNAVWESQPGLNLLATFIINHHRTELQRQVVFNMAVANAIHKWVVAQGVCDSFIKWPNDIYAQKKKLSGILIENILSGTEWKTSLVGIGININQLEFVHPCPISLSQLTGKQYSVSDCLKTLSDELRREMTLFFKKQDDEIRDYYLNHLFMMGIETNYMIGEKRVAGVIQGVDASGRLVISIDGEIHTFANKEIRFIPV
jgi:BirA family biotin operon repressor/biotin-[acetyl-CoA-carboxylase] ligase